MNRQRQTEVLLKELVNIHTSLKREVGILKSLAEITRRDDVSKEVKAELKSSIRALVGEIRKRNCSLVIAIAAIF